MIKVMTSSYSGDLEKVTLLNAFLESHGIDHYIFVEPGDVADFRGFKNLRLKTIGGDNGMGRAGSMVRWEVYQNMLMVLQEGDTYVQLDSDIDFIEPELLKDLECEGNEMKGFFNFDYPFYHNNFRFFHGSGFCISAGYEIFKKSVPASLDECQKLCNEMIFDSNLVPSEDVVLSYLLQLNGADYKNLNDKYINIFKSVKGERMIKYKPTII